MILPPNVAPVAHLLTWLYLLTLAGLALYALDRVRLLGWALLKSKSLLKPRLPGSGTFLPSVCVQCPVYNEPGMIEGLIESVGGLQWPDGKLEIQLLDDSTDETSRRIQEWIQRHPVEARRIRHLRRTDRTGYKAGALASGLARTSADFLVVLDADFRPHPQLLNQLMPEFLHPEVGAVQARWAFRNRRLSWFTRLQAWFLDVHFFIEQSGRFAAKEFVAFNGTAGIWRRAALEDAGGWASDTVTEDLDASLRMQLLGWRLVYRPDVAVESELPEQILAFRRQQQRWAKGGAQVARKLAGEMIRRGGARALPGLLQITAGAVHPLAVGFLLISALSLLVNGRVPDGGWLGWLLFASGMLASVGAGVAAQYLRTGKAGSALALLLSAPLVLAAGASLAPALAMSFLNGLVRRGGEFVRTPKRGDLARPTAPRLSQVAGFVTELSLAGILGAGAAVALGMQAFWIGGTLALHAAALGLMALTCVAGRRMRPWPAAADCPA